VLAAGSWTAAQPVKPPRRSATDDVRKAPEKPRRIGGQVAPDEARLVDSTLYMIVQVNKDSPVPPNLVRDAIIDGRDALNEQARAAGQPPVCEFETPLIRVITESVYREFASFADQDNPVADAPPGEGRRNRVRLQPVPSGESLWAFDLNAGDDRRTAGGERDLLVVQELKITRKSGKVQTYKPVRLGEAREGDDLKMILPGSYILKIDLTDPPTRYDIQAQGIVGGKVETIAGDWPKSDQFLVIILRNFHGDRKRLFEAVKAKEPSEPGIRVPNPLDDVRLDRDFLLTFASVGVKLQIAPPEFEPGRYMPTMPLVPKREPIRTWILFPLTREEAESELAKLRDLDSGQIAQVIRSATPSLASQEAELEIKPGMRPRWIELPKTADGQRFRRELTIRDYKGLQAGLPEVWRLEVYEGQLGDRPRAILVAHPQRTNEGVYVAERRIENWPGAIEKGVKDEELAGKRGQAGR
jgi:hypothetical protein